MSKFYIRQFVYSEDANMRQNHISDCTVTNIIVWKVTQCDLVEIYQTDNLKLGDYAKF